MTDLIFLDSTSENIRKFLITPSKDKVKKFYGKIKEIVERNKSAKQEIFIRLDGRLEDTPKRESVGLNNDISIL